MLQLWYLCGQEYASLSSLILLSDKILSSGVKNIHVVKCLIYNAMIILALSPSCILSSGPSERWGYYPSQEGTDFLIKRGLLPVHTAVSPEAFQRDIHRLQIDLHCLGQRQFQFQFLPMQVSSKIPTIPFGVSLSCCPAVVLSCICLFADSDTTLPYQGLFIL